MSQLSMSYVNNVLQTALNSASAMFSSKTSPVDAQKELDNLADNLNSLTTLLADKKAISLIEITTVSVPKGVSVGVSFSKTTSAIKHLSAPISNAEASAILNSYRGLQTKTLAFLVLFEQNAPLWENFAPGIREFGLKTLKQLFDSLSSALADADTASIPPSTVHEVQASVTDTIRSLSSKA